MKITAADLAKFRAVCARNELDESEIEACRSAYRRDPEAGNALYNALAREIPASPDTRQWVKLSPPPFILEKKRV